MLTEMLHLYKIFQQYLDCDSLYSFIIFISVSYAFSVSCKLFSAENIKSNLIVYSLSLLLFLSNEKFLNISPLSFVSVSVNLDFSVK